MRHHTTRRKRTIWLGIMLIIGFYALISFPRFFLDRGDRSERFKVASTPAKVIYKTIYSSDDSSSLIGFELHTVQQQSGYQTHQECSVIVKAMDPHKDDYKTYCKDIVKDLVDMYGSKNITISIYDSFEAYSLVVNDDQLLTDKDAALVKSHVLAVFDSKPDDADERSCWLTYFPIADNGLFERVEYNSEFL